MGGRFWVGLAFTMLVYTAGLYLGAKFGYVFFWEVQ